MGLRYNPPPGWPPAPEGFIPPPGWQPDPSWPPAPPGWQLVVDDSQMPTQVSPQPTVQANSPSAPPLPGDAARSPYSGPNADPYAGTGGGGRYGGPGGPYPGAGGSPSADATNPYAGPASPYAPPTNPYAPGGQQGGPGGQYGGPGGQYGGPGGQYGGPGGQYGGPAGPYGAGGPYGTPYGGYGGPYPPGRPYSPKTSGWAIASFVIGLLGGVILSVIFGIVALRRIKRLGQQGRGFAIAGLVLSGLWVLLIILLIIVGSLGNATRSSSTGQITHGGKLSVFSLAVGDCFDNPTTTQDVATVTAEPCNQPHSAQVYAKFNLTGSNLSYPGTANVTQLASAGCTARTGSIDRSKATNAMTVHFLFPDQAAWLGGRRAVTCMVVDPAGDITYSLLKS